jgi:hypothetical protein
MKACMDRRGIFLPVVIVLLAASTFAGAPASLAGDPPPRDIDAYLMADGRVDLDALRASGYVGSVNFEGYRVAQSPRPAAPAAKVVGDERWIMRFPDPCLPFSETAVMWNGDLVVAAPMQLYRWSDAGWTSLDCGINGTIRTLVVYNGDLIVGGDFTIAGGVAANRVARFDGQDWHALGFGVNGEVEVLSTFGGQQLVAAGEFTVAGTGYANRIAAWNGSSWSRLGDGLNEDVYAMVEYGNRLVAAGYFTSAGPVIVNYIAAWDGSVWSALDNGMNGSVRALAVHAGLLVAGGVFDSAGTIPTGNVAAWDGADWSALSGLDGSVEKLAVVDGQLYVFNGYTSGGHLICRWDDPVWTSLTEEGLDSYVSVLLDFDGRLLVLFNSDQTGAYVWNGEDWEELVSPGLNGDITAMIMYDGDLIIAGEFSRVGDVQAHGIVRWDWTHWHPLGTGVPDNDSSAIMTLAVHNGDLIVGGQFGEMGGVTAVNIARWNGSIWSALGEGLGEVGYSDWVRALVSSGELLYAGGDFDNSGPRSATNLASWNGASWTDLNAGYSASVRSLAMYEGDLIVGGYNISSYGCYIAGLGSSGWYPLGTEATAEVTCLSVYDGKLIAGWTGRIAAWNGSSWSALAESLSDAWSGSGYPYSLAVYNDRLWVGGHFASVNGVSALNVARWDGVSWGRLGSGAGDNNYGSGVSALVDMGSTLAVGGSFTMAGGQPSGRFAIYADASAIAVDDGIPHRLLRIEQNHPNPFNPMTTIRFDLPAAGSVRLAVYDVAGRLIRTLVDGELPPGAHEAAWDGRDSAGRNMGSGSYLAQLEAGGKVEAVKMVLIR